MRRSSQVSNTVRLVVRTGDTTRELEFEKGIIAIGRLDLESGAIPDVDLTEDEAVSRFHAEIRQRGSEVFVVDIGSLNGTRLGEAKLAPFDEHPLRDGDVIGLGDKTDIRVTF
jgi:pSer/pThr/pTyr-binding forkhead associated (FHA) protein